MKVIIVLGLVISISVSCGGEVIVTPIVPENKDKSVSYVPHADLKSVGKARLLSAICPGAGEFYVHNYLKGVMDFGIEALLVGGTIFCWNARADAPIESADGMSQEDYTVMAALCGVGALGYYIFQIVRLNDDVVVYNYKKLFLSPSSLRLNFNTNKYSIQFSQAF
ncbi:MAG: hypothetical protein HY769_06065 [Candidatus Stahlbacteria bacterium]|nr:hypothetical protein [Candidatus Stahlbacteria bacterium]